MSDVIQVQGRYYIQANASIADLSTRVLKHADTFAIFDRHGDIRPFGLGNQGLFHDGTRFISRWKLKIGGTQPLLLSSSVKEDSDFLVVDLTNPPLTLADKRCLQQGTLHFERTLFLWEGTFFERLEIVSFAREPLTLTVELEFEADYADMFEIRGMARKQRGRLRPPVVNGSEAELSYEGLDAVVRRTRIHFKPEPQELTDKKAVFRIELAPQERRCIDTDATLLSGRQAQAAETFDSLLGKVQAAYRDYQKNIPHVETSNPQFNDWINQSRADLHLLLTETPAGLYPYAGIPWFSCVFGRDGIITALETLWIYPRIARGVLSYLASRQATESDAARDAEPGKILHEERTGEMVALNEVPFGRYYGSIDSTPLWLILAGCYYERTADKAFIAELWPHVERALAWIAQFGDSDGDGFVEYAQRASGGLNNQGWKDSEDAVFHQDGSLPAAPIALCEVQGYVYEAKLRSAQLAEALGRQQRADALRGEAEQLKRRFHEAFWCEEIKTYAIALDGRKKACRVRSSNAGQCLFTGIASPAAAAHITKGLLDETFFSGWGIRTIASSEARYNPMSYHNGSVWPHDNALIAAGMVRYGFKREAVAVLETLFAASRCVDLNRLPELYCGMTRRPGEGPTLYPVACSPQAWSSAAVFCLLQACLGLRVDAANARLYLENPSLPDSLRHLEIRDLPVGTGSVDLELVRHDKEVGVNVRRRTGRVEVVAIH